MRCIMEVDGKMVVIMRGVYYLRYLLSTSFTAQAFIRSYLVEEYWPVSSLIAVFVPGMGLYT